MGVILVTGSNGGGQPHVTSAMDGIMHAGMLGTGGYLLKTRKWDTAPVAKDSNHITIPAWDLVLEGRQMMIDTATDVNIQSGSQGMKRSDLIVARYTMNATTGVETCSLVALKGTATSGTPTDPAYNTGSIIGGAIVSDLPLCRVNLDGINITGIDTLVNVLAPLSDVWDSLLHIDNALKQQMFPRFSVTASAVGKIVTVACSGNDVMTPNKGMSKVGQLLDWCAPATEVHTLFGIQDGAWGYITILPDGSINLRHMYGPDKLTWAKVVVTTTFIMV